MNGGIYKIVNTKNNKVYVGKAKNFANRKRQHFNSLLEGSHYNKYLQRSFDKYGIENFEFIVIEHCCVEDMNDRERYWIKELESEYADKGYNAAYAFVLFKQYDASRKLNRSKRKVVKVKYTDAVREKFRKSIGEYWKDKDNHIRLSLKRSSMSYETIVGIKNLLKDNLDISLSEVAEHFEVSPNSVQHMASLASHELILSKYNYIINNRRDIKEKRMDKLAIRLYREGTTYKEIGESLGIHQRNAIRRINSIKTKHDDRCRLNVIKRASMKKTSIARTLSKMGYSDVKASKLLKCSRSYFCSIRKGMLLKEINDLNKLRGKVSYFKYSVN